MPRCCIKIPERVVEGKRLGRHIVVDPRSTQYPAETASTIVSVRHASAGLPLDQGSIGSCTANALVGALNTVPHWKQGNLTLGESDAVKLYGAETALEGEPYPPNDPGGSGLEVCKAAKSAGLLSGYQHASNINDALAALVIRPVITGVSWFPSFDTPDANGVVHLVPGETPRGGHEFVVVEIDATNRLVWCPNSWGLAYGVARGNIPGGCFAMSWDTWDTLLQQGGDVTVPRTASGMCLFVAQTSVPSGDVGYDTVHRGLGPELVLPKPFESPGWKA